MNKDTRKQDILEAIRAHIMSRPGLQFANYGTAQSYRAEQRSIAIAKRDALELLSAVATRDISADDILDATRAFSGRLSIKEEGERRVTIDYCTGQYYPTEYRKAACAVLASALRGHFRKSGCETGNDIREQASVALGARLAKAWFN